MGWWLQLESGSISFSISTQELEDVSNLTLISLTDFINYIKIPTCNYLNGQFSFCKAVAKRNVYYSSAVIHNEPMSIASLLH